MECNKKEGDENMRTVKFRAWDKTRKIMSIDLSLDFLRNYANNLNDCFLHFAIRKGLYVMQYTGLKDKNSKEIYEGDIVKVRRKDDCYSPSKYYTEITIITLPKYEELEDIEMGGRDGTISILWTEIIGNIYENPELVSRVGERK